MRCAYWRKTPFEFENRLLCILASPNRSSTAKWYHISRTQQLSEASIVENMQCKSTVIDYTQLNVSSKHLLFRSLFLSLSLFFWIQSVQNAMQWQHFQLNLLTIFCILNQKRARNFYSTQFTVMFRMCNAIASIFVVSLCAMVTFLLILFLLFFGEETHSTRTNNCIVEYRFHLWKKNGMHIKFNLKQWS